MQHHEQVIQEKGKGFRVQGGVHGAGPAGVFQKLGIDCGGAALDLPGQLPGILFAAAGGDLVIKGVVALVVPGVDDEGADDAADAGLNIRLVGHSPLQNLVQQGQGVAHTGQEKTVLVAKIFIEDAHGDSGGSGNGIDIGPVQAALGELVDAGLQDEIHGFFIELFIHNSSPPVRVVSGNSQDGYSIHLQRRIRQQFCGKKRR